MPLTLLQYTQNILSALNSDQVNSIGDTPESLQVAECVRTTYMNMLGRYEMPEHIQLINLEPSNSIETPVLMYRPSGVTRIEWIKYFDTNPEDGTNLQVDQFGAYSKHDVNVDLENNAGGWQTTSTTSATIGLGSVTFTVTAGQSQIAVGQSVFAIPTVNTNYWMYGIITGYVGTALTINITSTSGAGTFTSWTIGQIGPNALSYPGYKDVEILPVEEFLRMTQSFNPTESDVEEFTLTVNSANNGMPQVFNFYYKNDKQPQYCCIISNYYIIFDSFDDSQDSTLQASKTMSYGWVTPEFVMEDSFIPNLQEQQVPLLLNDAKSLAFTEIKNQPHQKAEEEVARQLVSLQKWKALADHPTYFDQLPNFGRSGPNWMGSRKLGWR